MADERNRWLDRAAAERVLNGTTASPDADRRARDAEDRLRAALDMLVPPQAPAGTELPGEAAALAAFRAARAGADTADVPGSDAAAGPVMDLGSVIALPAPAPARAVAAFRPGRPVRFALAAALASVAVGGLAAAAGAGLLDRVTHTSAGPAPAATLSALETPAPPSGGVGPTSAPQLRPDPFRSADGGTGAPATPDGSAAGTGPADGSRPGSDFRFGGSADTSSGAASAGATGSAGKETLGGANELHNQDRATRLKAVDLCEAYRSGSMNADRRDRLSRLAKGLSRIPQYCEELLDGTRGSRTGTAPRSSEDGGEVLKAPPPGRAAPMTQSAPAVGTASPGVRVPR
ncbi:hypothetical protein HYE82_31475 [Streptomyces sp. BR123]|uniref:hypothetical protein n=1 Tax=Streptomyces sp. BR123 TaxID=2749828 RepID=UPI0015C4C540|nr:hypothetical protein [Streptomyces sp. BR123]NXY98822.1 hypothetical protein [Streptomyces sp. BR123]